VNPQYEYTVAQGFCKEKMMHNIYQWFNRMIDTEEALLILRSSRKKSGLFTSLPCPSVSVSVLDLLQTREVYVIFTDTNQS
jgi:hypothetical protein